MSALARGERLRTYDNNGAEAPLSPTLFDREYTVTHRIKPWQRLRNTLADARHPTQRVGRFGREEAMTRSTNVCAVAGIVIGLMVPTRMAFADPDNLPPGQFPAFAAQWEQWATSIPNSESPLFDTTGEKCMVGQRDIVWFLAGVSGGGSATRTCSVPEDRTLFFPV